MTLKWDDKVAANIKRDPFVVQSMLDDGWMIAEIAANLAPRSDGPHGGVGAASIRAELVKGKGEPEVRVSWDQDSFYLGFRELGTEHENARPFLRPAANRFA